MESVLDLFRLNVHGLLNILASLMIMTLGMTVFVNNPRAPLQRSFFVFTLASSVWLSGYGFMSLIRNSEAASFWLRYSYLGVCLIPPTLYVFSQQLINAKNRNRVFVAAGFLIAAIIFGITVKYQQNLNLVHDYSWGRFNKFSHSKEGVAYFSAIILFFILYIGPAYHNFWKGYLSARSPLEKRHFLTLCVGFSVGYLGLFDFAVAYGFGSYPFGYLALSVFISVLGYSILRHRLWDVGLSLRRAATVLMIYLVLFGIAFSILVPITKQLLGGIFEKNLPAFFIMSIVFGIVWAAGPFIYAFLMRNSLWLKKGITAGLTHELKSPLGIIRSSTELLQDAIQDPDASATKIHSYFELIEKNTRRLETLAQDLLNIAKSHEGQLTIERKACDLSEIINESVSTLQPLAVSKGLTILYEKNGQGMICGDAEKLRQVISNLLSNATKFSSRGTILISMKTVSGEHCISVSDEGPGIETKDLDLIFNPLYQGKRSAKGSGLGLSIAKAWVEAHGGRIWAESEGEGKGTTIRFTVPVG